MEIPTEDSIDGLDNLASKLFADADMPMARIKVVLDAREVIKAQALEIQELQAVIVRLRDESQRYFQSSRLECRNIL